MLELYFIAKIVTTLDYICMYVMGFSGTPIYIVNCWCIELPLNILILTCPEVFLGPKEPIMGLRLNTF